MATRNRRSNLLPDPVIHFEYEPNKPHMIVTKTEIEFDAGYHEADDEDDWLSHLYVNASYDDMDIGGVTAEPSGFFDWSKASCVPYLRKLRWADHRGTDLIFVMTGASIKRSWSGTGLGVELYARLAELAARRFGAVVVAHQCVIGGETSQSAARVWRSRRLRERVQVVGRVMSALPQHQVL